MKVRSFPAPGMRYWIILTLLNESALNALLNGINAVGLYICLYCFIEKQLNHPVGLYICPSKICICVELYNALRFFKKSFKIIWMVSFGGFQALIGILLIWLRRVLLNTKVVYALNWFGVYSALVYSACIHLVYALFKFYMSCWMRLNNNIWMVSLRGRQLLVSTFIWFPFECVIEWYLNAVLNGINAVGISEKLKCSIDASTSIRQQ